MAVQMIIGDFPFSISTAEYNELRRTLGWRWIERNRLNRSPSLQYQGPKTKQISFKGVIHVQTERQLLQPLAMEAVANKGQPLNVLASEDSLRATYLGQWVITDLDFVETDLQGNGIAETIEFVMNVKAYGGDFESSRVDVLESFLNRGEGNGSV